MTWTDIARAEHNRDRLRFPSDLTDREWAVRAAAFLRRAFIFEKASSIGLKSGLYGGRKSTTAPAASMASRMAAGLWAGRLSRTTTSPGLRVGTRTCSIPAFAGTGSGEEGGAGHRAVDGHRCDDAAEREATDERRRLPVPVRNGRPAALASGRAAVAAGHLGGHAAFVDEDEAFGIEVRLAVEPGVSPARYVRPVLLGGVGRLFLRVTPPRLKKSCMFDPGL